MPASSKPSLSVNASPESEAGILRGGVFRFAVALVYIGIGIALSLFGLERLEQSSRQQMLPILESMNATAAAGMLTWQRTMEQQVVHLAADPTLGELTALAQSTDPDAQTRVPQGFDQLLQRDFVLLGAQNMALVNAAGLVLASLDTQNAAPLAAWLSENAELLRSAAPGTVRTGLLRDAQQRSAFIVVAGFAGPTPQHSGALVVRFDVGSVLAPITLAAQFGASGESYVLDAEARILTPHRFDDAGMAAGGQGLANALGAAMRARSAGNSIAGYADYRGARVLGAWQWVDSLDIGIVTEVDEAEALQAFAQTRELVLNMITGLAVLTLVVSLVLALQARRGKQQMQAIIDARTRDIRLLAGAVEQNPMAIMITAQDGTIQYVNASFEDITGYRTAEVLGKTPALLKGGQTPVATYADLWHTIQAGQTWEGDLLNRRKDGTLYWSSTSIAPVSQGKGSPLSYICMAADVSAQKAHADVLREQQRHYELLLDHAGDGIIGLDRQGAVTYCNQAAALMLGFQKEELLGKVLHETSHHTRVDGSPYPRHECPMFLSMQQAERREVSGEYLWRQDGSALEVDYVVVPLRKYEQVIGSVLAFKDVSRRNRADAHLRASEKQFRTLLESVPDPLLIVDSTGTILMVNHKTELVLGYRREELLGQKVEMLVAERYRGGHEAMRNEYIADPDHHRLSATGVREVLARAKSGRDMPMELTLNKIETETGVVFAASLHDIAERKQAQERLQRSEERFELTVAGSGDGLWDVDLVDGKAWFSERVRELLGYQGEAELPNSMDEFMRVLHPADAPAVMAAYNAHIATGEVYNIEFRMRTRSGDWRWFNARGKSLRDASGHATRMAGSLSDIHERRALQGQIEREREELRRLLEASPLGVGVTVQGRLRFANPRFLDMFAVALDAPIQGIYVDITAREHLLARLQTELRVENLELEMYDREGRTRDILATFMNFTLEGEQGVIGWLLDITERKLQEKLLRESELRLNNAAEAARIGLWEFVPDSGEVTTNEVWAFMLGYGAGELFEQVGSWLRFRQGIDGLASLIHPEDLAPTMERLALHLRGEAEAFTAESRMRCADGSWKWLRVSGQIIDRHEDGSPARVAGVHLDIDAQRQLQEQLVRARIAAEDATAAKSNFLANMSHEIRTPMNAIIGMSHLALKTDLDARQRKYLEKVSHSAQALLGIINDILDFSKIEAGKLALETNRFELQDVLEDLVTVVGFKAEENGLELLIDVPRSLPASYLGDSLRLGQVLVNLVNNAIKFTPQGEVVLSVRQEWADAHKACLHFAVRDTGIGMSEEQRNRLFQSFSQGDASTTRRFGGTGLGLAISRNIVQLMQGEIWVESEPEQGSTFHFTVQLALAETADATAAPAAGPQHRALVVDDNPAAREILLGQLADAGCEAVQAASGEAALEALVAGQREGTPFDLLFIDWKMPQLDGLATVRRLKALDIALPRIVLVTAYGREDASDAASGLPVETILTKPILQRELQRVLSGPQSGTAANEKGPNESGSQALREALASLRGARVLLVEDNEDNLELALELLQSNGLEVVTAMNGRQALEALEQHVVDGVLMDIQMPVMDGYEATRAIRQQARWRDLPILAMTASTLTGDRDKAIAAGMQDHISKPIDVEHMFRVLARWVHPAIVPPVVTPAPQTTATPVPAAAFPALEGIDSALGLRRTQNNAALYRKLLARFASGQGDIARRLAAAIAADDWVLAQREVHTFKGLAGTIGALALQQLSERLEADYAQRTDNDVLLAELTQELARVLQAIAGLDSPPDAGPATSAESATAGSDTREACALLRELLALVEAFDTAAQDLLEARADELAQGGRAALVKGLRRALGSYDFDAAQALITQFLQDNEETPA